MLDRTERLDARELLGRVPESQLSSSEPSLQATCVQQAQPKLAEWTYLEPLSPVGDRNEADDSDESCRRKQSQPSLFKLIDLHRTR